MADPPLPLASTDPCAHLDLEALARGQRAAVEALVDAVEPRLYGLALRLVRDPDRARDLVQEAFVRALASLASYRREAPIAAWIARILVNAWRNQHRRATEDILDPDYADPGAAQESDAVHARELEQRLEAGLARLSPTQRAAILLRSRVEMSYDQIALALGVSTTAVKVHIHAARERLAAWLGLDPRKSEERG